MTTTSTTTYSTTTTVTTQVEFDFCPDCPKNDTMIVASQINLAPIGNFTLYIVIYFPVNYFLQKFEVVTTKIVKNFAT